MNNKKNSRSLGELSKDSVVWKFRNTALFLIVSLLFSTATIAETRCFIAKEHGRVIQQEGDCVSRYSPASTFKIVMSLMGYDSGILKDETHPEWPFEKGYLDYIEECKKPHNPRLWIKDSCVWYSQVLTQKLGMKKFKEYVAKFNYGNKDVSGDKGQGNGLTRSWLSSSLEISPEEQIVFLQKFLNKQLPVSPKSYEMTKNILFIENLPDGWKLYGKTGSGYLLSKDRTQKLDIQHGWFVGFIQKNDRTITFSYHIVDDKKKETYAGPRAKAKAKEKLLRIIEVEQK